MDQDASAIECSFKHLIETQAIEYHPQWQNSSQLPTPPLVIANSEKALAEVVAIAHKNHWSIIPCGQSSKLSWGGLPRNINFYLSTRHLNQIIDHAVEDLTVTLQAGVSLSDLQKQLQRHNQFLPIDPAYPETATLGGIVATADTGSWRERYGGVRDLLIGISFVRADGEIAKAGGRVVKNVAGYDLMKLFTGSYGTLGIITQVTFRTYPLPSAATSVILTGNSDNLIPVAQILRNSTFTPTRADLLSPSVVEKLNLGNGCGLIVQFETIIESIEKQIQQLSAIAQSSSLEITRLQQENEKSLWNQLKSLASPSLPENRITCKIGLLPTATRELFQQLPHQTYAIIHNKSGLGKLILHSEQPLSDLQTLRDYCEKNKGFLTILEAPQTIKQQIDPWGYSGNALTLMKQLKQQFDPKNQFNPNRFVGGI